MHITCQKSKLYIYHLTIQDITPFINAKKKKYRGEKTVNLSALFNFIAYYCQDIIPTYCPISVLNRKTENYM